MRLPRLIDEVTINLVMKIDKCGFTERKVEAEIKDWDMINLGNIMIV